MLQKKSSDGEEIKERRSKGFSGSMERGRCSYGGRRALGFAEDEEEAAQRLCTEDDEMKKLTKSSKRLLF